VDISDVIQLYYVKTPFVIDTAQDGVSMTTNLYDTTRTSAGGDHGAWLLLTQEDSDVLFVSSASEDLLSLGQITSVRYKATIYAGVLQLLFADLTRMDEVALSVTAVNDVFPINLRSTERTDAEIKQVSNTLQAHIKKAGKAYLAFLRVVTAKHVGEENLPAGQGQAYINHCIYGHRAGAPGRLGLPNIPLGACMACMMTGMPNLMEPDEGKRTAEHFLQYVVVDAQGPFPTSIRGIRYWVAVVDTCTKLKLSFPPPTLTAAMKILDHMLKRECNRTNREVQTMFQSVSEPRTLDASAILDNLAPKVDLDDARKGLVNNLLQFEGILDNFEKLHELKARPTTIGVLRLDGAPNQRGTEMDKVAADLGASVKHPAPHDHKSMGAIEGFYSVDLKSGMAQMYDAGAPVSRLRGASS
jgi:hypothetical protein